MTIFKFNPFTGKPDIVNDEVDPIFTNKGHVQTGGDFFAFGDSITVGTGASATAKNFVSIVADTLGLTPQNYGVTGRGVFKAVESAYANLPNTLNMNAVSWMAGLNDYRRGGASAATIEKAKGCLMAFLANSFLASAVSADDISVTSTGSWSNIVGGSIGDKASNIGGLGQYSSDEGATLEWTFDGDTLVIGTWGVDEVAEFGGVIEIDVDGTVIDTYDNRGLTDGISDGTYDNRRTQNALVYRNLGSGSHTVTITITEVSVSGNIYIDYFGTLNNPQMCATVFVADIPKLNATGYATAPANATNTILNAGDQAQYEVIRLWYGFPIVIPKTNTYSNTTTDLDPDGIHRDDSGYAGIASAYLHVILQTQHFEGVTSIANIGAVPNAAGGSISSNILTLQPADPSNPGLITSGQQAFGGDKYFNTGGIQILGPLTVPTGSGSLELEYVGDTGFLTTYNRAGSAWKPMTIRGSSIVIQNDAVTVLSLSGNNATMSGNFSLSVVGNGFYIKEGSNATMGTATLSGGTIVVNTTKVTANSRIFLTVNGGTLTNVGSPYISARTAGTSFTISSTNVLDSSNVAWIIIEPS